jgi:3',5'-cyclic AMP phosphodiesterase CpdA
MQLWAISDVHVGYDANRRALQELEPHPDDWLAVVGDVGETEAHLKTVLDAVVPRFARILWAPGNHELWTSRGEGPVGEAKYARLVDVCRERGVSTPEDSYPVWPDSPADTPIVVAPLFLLYDYSFAPDEIGPDGAVAWASQSGIVCADETYLDPAPYPSRAAWCAARCALTEQRLAALAPGTRTVLLNHFPLRREHAVLPRIPRFAVWCGTRRTADWHTRFRAVAVVSGHLHIRSTRHLDGVRFEEVSLGYPSQWDVTRGAGSYLRQILPAP